TIAPSREIREQVYVQVYFDPVSKPAFRSVIRSALDKYITASCTNMLMERLSMLYKETGAAADTNSSDKLKKIMQGVGVRETSVSGNNNTMHISSVQHNVPAWAIF